MRAGGSALNGICLCVQYMSRPSYTSTGKVKFYFCELDATVAIFTNGEAIRSTCGNSHDEEEEEHCFHLSLHQTILWPNNSLPDFGFPRLWASRILSFLDFQFSDFHFPVFEFPRFLVSQTLGSPNFGFPRFWVSWILGFPDFELPES